MQYLFELKKTVSFTTLLLFLLASNFVFAQQDSLQLEQQIKNETSSIEENIDLDKIEVQIPLSYFSLNARRNALANRAGISKAVATTATNMALYYFQHKDYNQAAYYFQQSIEARNKTNNIAKMALTMARLAYVYDRSGSPDRAIDLYNQAIKLFEQEKMPRQLAETNFLVSKLLIRQNKTDAAEDYLKKGAEASKEGQTKALGNNINNLLTTIDGSKREKDAYLARLLATEKTGFATMTPAQKTKLCKDIGYVYWNNGEYEKANDYFNKSVQNAVSLAEISDLPDDPASRPAFYKFGEVRKWKDANEGWDKIRDSILNNLIADHGGTPLVKTGDGISYSNLSADQIKQITLSTDDQIRKLLREKDSLAKAELYYNDEEISQKIAEINQLIKEKQIQAYAMKNKDLEVQKQKYYRYVLYAIAALLLMIIFVVFFRYWSKQRSLKKVKSAYEELNETHEKLKEAQKQLVQSEKMASLGQLTAGIAHEINNPINFVSSSISSLRRDLQDMKMVVLKVKENPTEAQKLYNQLDIDYTVTEVDELIAGIDEGANRTSEIVKGLRNFSRTDESVQRQADINECITSTVMILQTKIKEHAVTVTKHLSKLPEINCYPGQLNQVFMNIITNAIDAIDENTGKIDITTVQDGNNIITAIADNGKGMTEEVKKKIFDPFFTTKDVGAGTGLGLSISFGIIEKHNGTIEVESEPGKGTKFIITLPVS